MAFNSEQKTVSNKLLSEVIYNIPRNQRSYVWNEKNWRELWNDVLFTRDCYDTAHFIGSVVLMDKGEIEGIQKYDIIDGQQRIISLVLFVSAIMQIYKERKEEDLRSGLTRFLLSTDLSSRQFCKICSEYQPSIEKIVEKVALSSETTDEILDSLNHHNDKQVAGCFLYYYQKLSELNVEEIKSIQRSLLRINYIDITATTQEDSYTIFEILNARGLALEDSELLKNYIMRYSIPKSLIDRVRQEWVQEIETPLGDGIDRFLIHYVRHKYKTSGSKISAYSVIKDNNKASTVSDLFIDIKKKSGYYKKLIKPIKLSDEGDCSNIEYRVFRFLKAYRGELFRPLLLSLMHIKEKGLLSEHVYDKLLSFFQYYFTCYNLISQETSNKISGGVQKYAYLIENDYKKEYILEVMNYLIERLPAKREFTKSFSTLGWSHEDPAYNDSSNKRKVQIALSTIEFIKTGATSMGEFTIEHILPDSVGNNALIGNLLPLEDNINQNCKDKTLQDKIPFYQESNFKSVRDFVSKCDIEDFDSRNRANQMASIIYDKLKSTSKEIRL